MRNIDERVVKMQFDNKQFESGVKTSIGSVETLKKSLNFDASIKSMSSLDAAGKSFSMGGLTGIAAGIQAISDRFSSMGIIGIATLTNLTNSAVNSAKTMVSALTIDPIKMGLQEYETKMGAIQTILTNTASKGTTLDEVNATLEELNTYADQTIYNFSEMTRNIGTFTAAGIDLETSAQSIKGIANLAAGSGSNAQQASTAMYQLSQALAAGKVSLMDWNSVVNAGMGGELFQNALKDQAKSMGIYVDESKPFRETLEQGWLTAEVLTGTLQKFAEDESLLKAATEVKTFTQLFDTMKESVQSGWAVSWENIIGDKEESAKMLTSINDAFGALIGPSTEARNEMLAFWNANGGRDAMIEGISNAFKTLGALLKPVAEAFKEVFPPTTGEKLVEISKSFRDLTENFKIGEGVAEGIKNTFKGLFSVIDFGLQVVITFAKIAGMLVSAIFPISGGLVGVTGALGSFLTSMNETAEASGVFSAILDTIKRVLEPIPNMFGGFEKIAEIFYNLADAVGRAFSSISENVSNSLGTFNFERLFELINGGLFAAILLGIRNFVGSLTKVVSTGGGVLSGITDTLDSVKGCLEGYQDSLKAGVLKNIAIAIGILAVSLVVLSMIDPERLGTALMAITGLFIQLFASMAAFQMVAKGAGLKSMILLTAGMTNMAVAILLLSFAMKNLASLDWEGIAQGLVAVAGLSLVLIATSKLLSMGSKSMIKGSMGYVIFAVGLLVLAEAVEKLADIPTGDMIKGLLGITALCTALVIFMRTSNMSSMGIRTGLGLVLLASSLLILASAVQKFSSIKTPDMIRGLTAIGILLAQIVIFTKLTGNTKGLISTSVGLTILATSLLIFSKALDNMGGMKWEEIAKSMIVLSSSLIILSIAMRAMTGSITGAAALLVMATALAIFVPSLLLLSTMSTKEIVASLIVLAGSLAILGGAAVLLAPIVPAILAVSAALAVFGVACLAVGGGVLMLSAGLTALGIAGAAGVGALISIIKSMIGLIPEFLKQVAESIILFAKVIAEGAPAIASSIVTVFVSILQVIVENTPKILELVFTFILKLMEAFVVNIPKMVQLGMQLIIGVLDGIAANIGQLIDSGVQVVVNIIAGIGSMLTDIVQAGFDLMINFINGLSSAIDQNTPLLITAIQNLMASIALAGVQILLGSVGSFLAIGSKIMNDGIIKGIKNKVSYVVTEFKNIVVKSTSALSGMVKDFVTIGIQLVDGLKAGIVSKVKDIINACLNLASQAVSAVKKAFGIHSPSKVFAEIGMYTSMGLANGIRDYGSLASDAATNVGYKAINSMKEVIGNMADLVGGDVDINPTIKPVLDLSDVKTGSKGLDSLFANRSINVSSVAANASKVVAPNIQNESVLPKKDATTEQTPTYSFVQNNYSPKALSRIDIYRQTRNQLSSMKGVLNT